MNKSLVHISTYKHVYCLYVHYMYMWYMKASVVMYIHTCVHVIGTELCWHNVIFAHVVFAVTI